MRTILAQSRSPKQINKGADVEKRSKAVITIETSKLTVIRRIRRADESHSNSDCSDRKHGCPDLPIEFGPVDSKEPENATPILKSIGEHK